jgi:hypothetical protein
VVHANAWLKRGLSRGSGDSSCEHGVEAGFWLREAVEGAGAGLRRWWGREASAWSGDGGEWWPYLIWIWRK